MTAKKTLAIALCALIALAVACKSYDRAESVSAPDSAGFAEKSVDMPADEPAPPPMSGEAKADGMTPNVAENLALRGRKLIREGHMRLKVRSVEAARGELETMVAAAGGFVSNVNFQSYSATRNLDIVLRVPAQGFLPFVEKVRALGHTEEEGYDVTDVTDQYVDLDRRIRTQEALATRLEELIQSKSYQFKDLLEVERELARIRMEIESLQGTRRGLDDRIGLSTLRVNLYQDIEQQVVPPDSVFAPLLNAVENIGPRFAGSVRLMMKVIGGLISLAVWFAPWLAIVAVGLLILRGIIRRSRKPKG